MTRRRGLRLCLADAINNTLTAGLKVTDANARRYCDKHLRTLFDITFDTAIKSDDWAVATTFVQIYRAKHTTTEIYGNVDPRQDKRIRNYFATR